MQRDGRAGAGPGRLAPQGRNCPADSIQAQSFLEFEFEPVSKDTSTRAKTPSVFPELVLTSSSNDRYIDNWTKKYISSDSVRA